MSFFYCVMCNNRIPLTNVNGPCPRCGASGFKTLKAELKRKYPKTYKQLYKKKVRECSVPSLGIYNYDYKAGEV